MTYRDRLIGYVREKYKTEPEYLWLRFPDYAVFRHADNRKWFGIVMDLRRSRLGLDGDGEVDVLNVKLADGLFAEFLLGQPGYFRGYHFGKGNWVSILLDGTVPFEDIRSALDESYAVTASAKSRQKIRPAKEWIVPANPKYYDIEQAFAASDEIDWKQGAGIRRGDTVYIYVAAPVSAILYKCAVTETDIPFRYDDGNVRMKALMKIKLLKRFDPAAFTFEILGREYGVFAVRGPRSVPRGLKDALEIFEIPQD
ncbi:MAG: MmcQ/YjbR family DNA-binding protein [Clostridiales bacterium]|nr:MmcQ/YjbR family DNA-binding protein [Clostridiales bacterium]